MSPVMSNRRLAYSRQQLSHLHNSNARVGCYHNQLLWTRKSEWLTQKEFHCSVFIFQGNFIATPIMPINHDVRILSHTGSSLGASCVEKETIKFWGQIVLRDIFLCKIKLVPLLLYNNCKILPYVWCFCIKAGLVLHDFILCDFALMHLENLLHFSNLHDKFWFNAIWQRQSVSTLIFCRRLTSSDITVTPSVTCMDWLCWWYDHVADLVFSATALAFLANMNEKCKSTSPSAIQVKNWWKTIGIEEKFKKSEQIIGICYNVRFTVSSICTVCGNVNRIKESAKCWDNIKCQQSETERVGLCSKITTVLLEWTVPRTMGVNLLHFYCIGEKKIYIYIYIYIYTVYTVYIYSTGL